MLVVGLIALVLLAIARVEVGNWLRDQRREPQVAGSTVNRNATAVGASTTLLAVPPDKVGFKVAVPRLLPPGYKFAETSMPGWSKGGGGGSVYQVRLEGPTEQQRIEVCTAQRWQYLSACGYERAATQRVVNGDPWDCDTRSGWPICQRELADTDVFVSIWVVDLRNPAAVMDTVARTLTTDLGTVNWFPR